MNGIEVLPLMLVNGEVKVSFAYPTAEQLSVSPAPTWSPSRRRTRQRLHAAPPAPRRRR